MVYCKNCKSINVKISDLNFADTKAEGQPASKDWIEKREFLCWTCSALWYSDLECEKLYSEYVQLKNQTTLVAHVMRIGGTYTPQYIDPDKLMKRIEIAKKIAGSYRHTLDIGPWEWHDLEQDVL